MRVAIPGGLVIHQDQFDKQRFEVLDPYGRQVGIVRRVSTSQGFKYHFERAALSISLLEIRAISGFIMRLEESDRVKEKGVA
jgi:hypothetical protein